jgi:hypothetical protein
MNAYQSEDVQQILQRAMQLQNEGHFSREQLVEMAGEMGISQEILQQAEQVWLAERQTIAEQQRRRDRQRQGFIARLIPFVCVNTFLILLNVTTSPRHPWSIYPILGWGLGLVMHGTQVCPGKSKVV